MVGYPEGTFFIEIRGVYDGWSVAKLPTGELINRWQPGDRRYWPTQAWIELESKYAQPTNQPTDAHRRVSDAQMQPMRIPDIQA